MKIQLVIAATLLYGLLLGVIHYLHVSFVPVNVVFYAAIGDAVIASIAAGTVLFFHSSFRPLGGLEKWQLLVIWLLAGYGFAISVPTVIDRSLSFYILEKLQQRGGRIKQDKFEEVFIREYLPEHRLMEVRLTEQLQSGTIAIENGCVRLTEKGNRLASFGRFYRQNFLPKKRLLMGTYSDALTDPFRHSENIPDYQCK